MLFLLKFKLDKFLNPLIEKEIPVLGIGMLCFIKFNDCKYLLDKILIILGEYNKGIFFY
jgi:hypothetical protein